MVGIYKITNPQGKIYIGKSKDIEKRFASYLKLQHCSQQIKIYNSLKKYGPKNHIFEIIERCPESDLDLREIFWIKKLNSVTEGLNLTWGGDGGNLSEESQFKKSTSNTKPIIQYDLDGNFIQTFKGAKDAIEFIGKGNPNNINDCARGKYKSTYGYIWVYQNDENIYTNKISPISKNKTGVNKWSDSQRDKYINSIKTRKFIPRTFKNWGKHREKPIIVENIINGETQEFSSRKSLTNTFNISTWKLRNIINTSLTYKGFKYYDK